MESPLGCINYRMKANAKNLGVIFLLVNDDVQPKRGM